MEKWANVCEVEIVYKTNVKPSDRPQIFCSNDINKLAHANWNENTIEYREEFKVFLLNRSNKVLGVYELSKGGISGTIVDIKFILQVALKTNSSSIILVHNHPSGNNKPSQSDIQLTNKIKKGAELFDIKVLDHIIITPETNLFYSFADEGLI